jgi:hypothetical protein
MDGLSDDSEVHVTWALAPARQEPKPEMSELPGDKWYCASCYSEGQTWAPNWNDPGTIRAVAVEKSVRASPPLPEKLRVRVFNLRHEGRTCLRTSAQLCWGWLQWHPQCAGSTH